MIKAYLFTIPILTAAVGKGVVDPPSPPRVDQVLEQFQTTYAGLKSLYVEYELSESTPSVPGWDLQIRAAVALEGHKTWKRTIHFYPGLYEHKARPEYDPILNWILKTDQRLIKFEETTRRAWIFDREPAPKLGLEVEGYTGHIAYLEPDHITALEQAGNVGNDASRGFRLTARDYYLPWALRQPGWGVAPAKVFHDGIQCLLFERQREGHTTDRLWLDPNRGFALLKRELKDLNGQSVAAFEYADLQAATANLWLPRQVRAHYSDRSLSIYANVLQVNAVPASVFEPRLPSGTIVMDFQRRRAYVLPGGEELLDFTVERIRYFLSQSRAPGIANQRGSTGSMAPSQALTPTGRPWNDKGVRDRALSATFCDPSNAAS